MGKKQRSDAERRLRQCERLSRLLRTLHLLMGSGRWNVDSLADELECSRRTIYRDLQTLSMAGVPWYLDASTQSYRIRQGYRFPDLDSLCDTLEPNSIRNLADLQAAAEALIRDSENFSKALRRFSDSLNEARSSPQSSK